MITREARERVWDFLLTLSGEWILRFTAGVRERREASHPKNDVIRSLPNDRLRLLRPASAHFS